MTVTISLRPEEQRKLDQRAAAVGKDVAEYVQQLVRRDVESPLSISQAAEPIAQAVQAAGISDKEFDDLIESTTGTLGRAAPPIGKSGMSRSAVFDCMVFIQGAARPGSPARRCLDLVDSQKVTLFVSPATLAELNDVLNRPEVLRRLPTLDGDAARDLIRAIHARAQTVTNVPSVFQYARDPKDEPYVNLAIAAGAEYLVTRDKDLRI
jgi:putative PIN family toxin of toxin-antitoxin system